jgi:hypothetical protein
LIPFTNRIKLIENPDNPADAIIPFQQGHLSTNRRLIISRIVKIATAASGNVRPVAKMNVGFIATIAATAIPWLREPSILNRIIVLIRRRIMKARPKT